MAWKEVGIFWWVLPLLALAHTESVTQQCESCCSGLNPTQDYCKFCPEEKHKKDKCEASHHLRKHKKKSCLVITSESQCWSAVCPCAMSNYVGSIAHKIKHKNKDEAVKIPLVTPYPVYGGGETGIFDLATGSPLSSSRQGGPATGVKIGAAGDWGSGTCEANTVANLMSQDTPDLTFHLGDVYFVGDQEDFHYNVMGIDPPSYRQQKGVLFPKGSHTTFLMAGNHEQISGMNGLVYAGYKYSGQKANFGAWFSDHWRFIALDTGYLCMPTRPDGERILGKETPAPLPNEVVEWLKTTLSLGDPTDKRGIVLMSHHFPYSDFEKAYLGAAQQLNDILPEDRTILWFFGHEHRFALYEKLKIKANHKNSRLLGHAKHFTSKYALYGRMVGNGGYRIHPEAPKRHKKNLKIKAWDMRTYQEIPHDQKLGFNGYFKVLVNGDQLLVTYVSAKCKDPSAGGCNAGYNFTHGEVSANETITVQLDSGNLTQEWHYVNTDILSTTGAATGTEDLCATPIPWDADPTKQGVIYNFEHTSMD
ncbi:unnamed protein product [Symbiodinium sp. CCMP2592]|nr:unnamed protein product [Symbiodinium sp. CCMP2592]